MNAKDPSFRIKVIPRGWKFVSEIITSAKHCNQVPEIISYYPGHIIRTKNGFKLSKSQAIKLIWLINRYKLPDNQDVAEYLLKELGAKIEKTK